MFSFCSLSTRLRSNTKYKAYISAPTIAHMAPLGKRASKWRSDRVTTTTPDMLQKRKCYNQASFILLKNYFTLINLLMEKYFKKPTIDMKSQINSNINLFSCYYATFLLYIIDIFCLAFYFYCIIMY